MLFRQPEIDFEHKAENNSDSQQHFEANKKRFSNQCEKVLSWFQQGGTLTCDRANEIFMIKHLPRRICDLRMNGYNVQSRWIAAGGTRVKEYYLENFEI